MYLHDYIKMVITPLVINIFFPETCTIGFSTHRAINPCQKLNFYEKLQMVYFSIAGNFNLFSIWIANVLVWYQLLNIHWKRSYLVLYLHINPDVLMINNPIAALPEEPGDSYLQGSVTVTVVCTINNVSSSTNLV